MKIQKILTSLFAAAAILCSCEKEQEGLQLPGEIKTDLKFHTLEVVDISYNSATLSVKHDGTSSDTWYGFVSGNPGKSDAILIADKISEIIANGDLKKLNKRTSARVELTDLEPAKKYKYIVFAITPDGQIYGKSASITFTTEESSFLLSQCEDWTVSREGRDASTNQEIYTVKFNKTNAARCHVCFIPKSLVEYYEEMEDIKASYEEYGGILGKIGEYEFLFTVLDMLVWEELYEYWGYYDSDESYFTQETFSESYTFKAPRQSTGDYYAIAIGFKDCEPTLVYSVNEITIEEEEPSEAYEKWLGEWTITGKNNIEYSLRLEEADPNFIYYLYGWECGADLSFDFTKYEIGIPCYFDALKGELQLKSTVVSGEEESYYGIFGYEKYEAENSIVILEPEDILATAAMPVNGVTELIGSDSVRYDENGTTIPFQYGHIGYVMNSSGMISYWNTPVSLPATLTKSEATPVSVASHKAEMHPVRKQMADQAYKAFKTKDYGTLKATPEMVSKRIR